MRLLYNLLQLIFSPLLLLLMLLLLLRRTEKTKLILPRLGFGLKYLPSRKDPSQVIWIHALSVGEVTSALPLIQAIRAEAPSTILVFSATTTSGMKLANEKIRPCVQTIIPFPFDIVPVVTHFLKRIQPDLFILIETDFWPNLLAQLSNRNIPALLMNGRISEKSMRSYQRFSFFFKPIFNQFQELCMQTISDTENMRRLGISEMKLKTLGNLKFAETSLNQSKSLPPTFALPSEHLMIICGSTHRGEEAIILSAYSNLQTKFQHLHLAIAPRHISRSDEIAGMARKLGLTTLKFSEIKTGLNDILIIDTIGDLASLYSIAQIAFIGGSLVSGGGHNPLEAAQQGLPILFGPHMEDFSEISEELIRMNAAFEVSDRSTLETTLENLIISEELCNTMGKQARLCIKQHQNIISAHIEVIRQYL